MRATVMFGAGDVSIETVPDARLIEPTDALVAACSAACPMTTTEADMQLTKNSIETMTGPSEWFTGTVYVDTVATPSEPSRLQAASVHFTPGARTAWHTHPFGQTIYVTEGVGLCQRRGGSIEVIRPGDRVFFEPGEEHWHGAAPNRFMTHLAMQEVNDEGSPVTWGEHVTDEEYNAAQAA
jgi:quercetin dioxygenase-like cupin family protein